MFCVVEMLSVDCGMQHCVVMTNSEACAVYHQACVDDVVCDRFDVAAGCDGCMWFCLL